MPRKKHRGKGTRSEKLRKALCEKDVMGGLGGGKVLKRNQRIKTSALSTTSL